MKTEMIEYANGMKGWYLDGKLHREDGPAIEYPDGEKEWYWRGYHYLFNDGELRYGCENHPLEYWREHVRELCEEHAPNNADFYEREILRLIELKGDQ